VIDSALAMVMKAAKPEAILAVSLSCVFYDSCCHACMHACMHEGGELIIRHLLSEY